MALAYLVFSICDMISFLYHRAFQFVSSLHACISVLVTILYIRVLENILLALPGPNSLYVSYPITRSYQVLPKHTEALFVSRDDCVIQKA